MGEEGKKISFGFSKLKKPTNLVKPVVIEKKEVEYVDSFDGAKGKFSYKGTVREEPIKKDLVIPLIGTKTALEVIKARLEERQQKVEIKQEPPDDPPINGPSQPIKSEKRNAEDNKSLTIEDLAAKEIMEEIHGDHSKEETTNGLVISQDEKTKPNFEGKSESTLDDYETVPVIEYGLAMLRGMGWKPDKKKDPKDEVELPIPRPKGLGLGADKVMAKPAKGDEDLTIADKSYVRFVSGSNNGRYGQVQAVDGDTNRVVVKLALGGTVSVSEVILVPVSKKEYEKNSKIINSAKYEQYKEISDRALAEMRSEAARKEDNNSHRKEKYERSRERRKSSQSDDSEKYKKKHKHKKHRNSDDSSFSDEEKDRKHKKKNKKDKSRSSSRDRRHKKKKKKKYSDSESPPPSHRSRDRDSHRTKSSRR